MTLLKTIPCYLELHYTELQMTKQKQLCSKVLKYSLFGMHINACTL